MNDKTELRVFELVLELARDQIIKNLTADVVILEKANETKASKYEGLLVAAETRRCVDLKNAKIDTINACEELMIKEFPKLRRRIQKIIKRKRYAEEMRREAGVKTI